MREELLNVCRDYEDACTGSGGHSNNNNALRFTHESDVDVSGAEDDEGAVVGNAARELFDLPLKSSGFRLIYSIFKRRFRG